MDLDVVAIGAVNVDFVIRVAELPEPGETVADGKLEIHEGGKGANQAVASSRFGARTAFIGCIGDDAWGRQAVASLIAEDIDVSAVARTTNAQTGMASVVVDASGENQIAVAAGANRYLSPQHVEHALSTLPLGPTATVLISFEIPDETVVTAIATAKRRRLRVVVNPSPIRTDLIARLKGVELWTVNRGELADLGSSYVHTDGANESANLDVTCTRALLVSAALGAPVAVTIGALGALLATDHGLERAPAPAAPVVDTTGSGDTFAGVLAACTARGTPLTEAIDLAVQAASKSVSTVGARMGMPTRSEFPS